MLTRGRFLERSLVAVGKIVDSKYVFPIRSGKMIGLISIAMKGRVSSVCKFLPIFDTNDRWKFLAINKESLWSWSIPWTVKKGVCNKEDQRFKGMPIDRSVLETRYMEEWMVKDWRARYRANKFNTSSSIFKGFMSRRDPLIKVLSVDKTDRRCSSGKTTMMTPERYLPTIFVSFYKERRLLWFSTTSTHKNIRNLENVNDTRAHTCVIARDFRLWSGSGVNRKLLSIVKQETLEPRKL